jgi:hypothetical protein
MPVTSSTSSEILGTALCRGRRDRFRRPPDLWRATAFRVRGQVQRTVWRGIFEDGYRLNCERLTTSREGRLEVSNL